MFILCRRVAVVKILSLDVAKIEKHRLLVHLVKVVVVLPLILVVVKMVKIYINMQKRFNFLSYRSCYTF